MTENNDRINELLRKLEALLKKQDSFLSEIFELKDELRRFKSAEANEQIKEKVAIREDRQEIKIGPAKELPIPVQIVRAPKSPGSPVIAPKAKSDLEKFIGENLISKIGIVITIIGVAIGAKYSIEHKLISPLARIILGYLIGLGLLGFGIKLKKNYQNYSAVLVSGAMAILYFITYAAYSFYALMPQVVAFAVMVIITGCTVFTAISYNRKIIGHIGLVGAYAVPFLLSDGSGRVVILFSYMTIINAGILFIAFKKYWKSLYISSFALTWLIYYAWLSNNYIATQHFGLALLFLTIFFLTFYSIFLSYKLVRKEKFDKGDVVLLLANSFIFYGLGYFILNNYEPAGNFIGLFTLCNACIHFIVCIIIYREKLADRNLFYLVSGLVLVFITITIPVQLNGNWVTLLWVGEAALLFWIGRTKNVLFYEKLSYPLMLLSFLSLMQDWGSAYVYSDLNQTSELNLTPIWNIHFLTSVIFIAYFVLINYRNQTRKNTVNRASANTFSSLMQYVIPALLIIVAYFSVQLEISSYWDRLYINASQQIKTDVPGILITDVLFQFKVLWIINYSLLFFSILLLINIYRLKSRLLANILMGISAMVLVLFFTAGILALGQLRESYLNNTFTVYTHNNNFNILIRYISYAFAGFMLFSIYRTTRQEFIKPAIFNLNSVFELLFSFSLLVIASSELITCMELMNFPQSNKLGISILWGVYSLILIIIGIWKMKKHLRIAAIILFGVTLVKLLFYDLIYLDTIAKTIVFVSLGIILLIISFLYNKYKHVITENKTQPRE